MPDINDICYIIAVGTQLALLTYVIISGFDFDLETKDWLPQAIGAFVGASLTALVTLGMVHYKYWFYNRPPLEFKVALKKSKGNNIEKLMKFAFYYKNNTESMININWYHILIMEAGRDKTVCNPPEAHISATIVPPQKGWQEELSHFGWVSPRYYNIEKSGRYNITVNIEYGYKDKTNVLSDALQDSIEVD